jgi:integrase
MPRANITKRTIDSLKVARGEYFAWDSKLIGFGVRVQPSGAKSYVLKYRAGTGRGALTRRVTLGAVGKLTPGEARAVAKRALGAIAHGADPAADKAAERRGATLSELADVFLDQHVEPKLKARTCQLYSDVLRRLVLPELGSRRAEAISVNDIARVHAKLKRTPYQANRMLVVVGSLYSFAGKRHLTPRDMNPTRGIEKYPERGRERFLTTDELQRLGEALREAETEGIQWEPDPDKKVKHAPKAENRRTIFSPHATAAIRLLLFTGARLREILGLRWEWVDLERGLLLLPDSKTGRKAVVLNAPAIAVLSLLPRVGIYVIAGDNAEKPRADLNKPWRAVSEQAGLIGVRLHDLRHSHASVGAGAGLGLPIIGKLLGHTQASTTARYAHLDNDPLRRASERIGREIALAMGDLQTKRAETPLRHSKASQKRPGARARA